ncbi:hypothetical protein HYPSUDRAFT_200582 [Hypholoma sublateritium FD-334 SS-4]|uniref:DUF427 domain-containing protein n=1 Tax=Hypholoma sublateritium (strain FD-334 SS-4) TaxID=945553 RepID=A0A0D2P091_HYPSF|nr:hypothetical protein HYPSUDRAFT_200582 [Hypholoma sublateritium FD-334 SS-4]
MPVVRVSLESHLLAEYDATILVEGNHYFPPTSVRKSSLSHSNTRSVCPWKGTAAYYDAVIDGNKIEDVAWYYPNTISDKAKPIEGYVAFYKNKVNIEFVPTKA